MGVRDAPTMRGTTYHSKEDTMITEEVWRRNVPEYIIRDGRRIDLRYVDSTTVDDTEFLIFDCGKEVSITYRPAPGAVDAHPVITNIGVGREKVVMVNPIIGSLLTLEVLPGSRIVSCRWASNLWTSGIPARELPVLEEFHIRPMDREWILENTTVEVREPYLTKEDMTYLYGLFLEDEEWDAQYGEDQRIITREETFLGFLLGEMEWITRFATPEGIQWIVDRYWEGAL